MMTAFSVQELAVISLLLDEEEEESDRKKRIWVHGDVEEVSNGRRICDSL
jgi:hypothetical protein